MQGGRARLHSWRQKIKQHPVATVLITLLATVIVLIVLSVLGYIFNWGWTGLSPYTSPLHTSNSDFQRGKTLWDWMQLLIIPVVLAIGGYLFNLTVSRNEQSAAANRAQIEREAAANRDKTEREIALDNQREATLQEYINKMSELLLDKNLRESTGNDEVRKIARVRTLTILPRLDKERKKNVLLFLSEAGLIDKDKNNIVNLSGVNLSGADLHEADLYEANLRGADLRVASLGGANLVGADLYEADLSGANLCVASLSGANLSGAKLRGADLRVASLSEADLGGADLSGADLSGADLSQAYLCYADLSQANLKGATGITSEELEKVAGSLQGTTMPDGTSHPY